MFIGSKPGREGGRWKMEDGPNDEDVRKLRIEDNRIIIIKL